MEPTIKAGETFSADMTAYQKATPRRWEVVVFRPPNNSSTLWMFRVIGLPGETVAFSDGKLLIDGQSIDPPTHLQKLTFHCDVPEAQPIEHPYTIPDGHYYMLGDNPEKANDSRLWGALSEGAILGRVEGK